MLNGNDEIWKDIPEFEGRYQVSNLGLVRSIQDNHGNPRLRVKATQVSNKGYVYVQLFVKNVQHMVSVHSAVASAFVPNPEGKKTVNHIDGNKQNNRVDNLEWATYSENLKHAYTTGLKQAPKGCSGMKVGKTSRFHNVTYDPTKDRWLASVKLKGKMHTKLFPVRTHGEHAEVLAAQAVNELLDSLGIVNRPKNVIS